MLNHARTLLLNISGLNTPGPDFLGEEGVPEEFRAVALPYYVQAARAELFGTDPDRVMLNYRLRQYMNILHSTELVEHVLALDPRISYDPSATDLFDDAAFIPTAAGSLKPIHFAGQHTPDNGLGRLRQQWRVAMGNSLQVTVFQMTSPVHETQHTVTVANGVTGEVPLDRGLRCYFDPTPGNVWHVSVTSRPTWDLSKIVYNLQKIGEPRMVKLFGANPAEPYKTFRALWESHPFLPYKLGGMLLAVIYRSEAARRKEV